MKTPLRKVSVRVWRPLARKLEDQMERACIRRDAYLNRVLEVELPELATELRVANTAAGRDFIATHLDRLDRKLMTLTLQEHLVVRLDELAASLNFPRDAFVNRLLFLLVAEDEQIDRIFFDGDRSWRTEVWSERKHDGPFFRNVFKPLDPEIDPFWAIRAAVELIEARAHTPAASIYGWPITGETYPGVDLYGLNCHWPDSWLSAAEDELPVSLDDLLAEATGEPK